MKPTPQISSNRREEQVGHDRAVKPLTDYSYQSTAKAIVGSSTSAKQAVAESRTFRQTSLEFFRSEAGSEYVGEAMFFASIACVAAWPILVLIRELTRMMI